MAENFSAQVDAIILKTEKRMNALVRQSTQEVIDQAQLSVAKGGRMRVDTGFLRASGQMSLTGMPTGPVRGAPGETYQPSAASIVTSLSGFNLGMNIYFGWTANYAAIRETYDGFLAGAVQNWQAIVDKVTMDIKARIP